MFRLQIVEADRAAVRSERTDTDDTRIASLSQEWHDMRRQRKMAKIVGAEMQFEAIFCDPSAGRHYHSSIINEYVYSFACIAQSSSERLNRGKIGKVKLLKANVR